MAKADGVGRDEALRLAGEGKAVIWSDGGLHATEVLGAAQLMEIGIKHTIIKEIAHWRSTPPISGVGAG